MIANHDQEDVDAAAMTPARDTLEQIEQITDQADGLSVATARRLADLHHILIAGASLTTIEREEVFALWNRHVRFTQPAQGASRSVNLLMEN